MSTLAEQRPAADRPGDSATELTGARVLLVHEWLYTWAGSERCLDEIIRIIPHADVVAGTVTDDIRAAHPAARRAAETWLGNLPGARAHHRWFLPLHALAFASIDTSKYDLVISLSHAFAKLVQTGGDSRHVCYCFSPPRYLWDLRATYTAHSPLVQRLALTIAGAPLRAIDRWGAAGVDRFVSISRCVAERVRRNYGRDSAVVYPPVRPKSDPKAAERAPFLLSLGRLVPYKRIDLAIRAAERLQTRLVVAGEGPDRARLEALAGPHTEFLGQVSEAEASRLLSTCAAFVFCAEEDFGIAPVEANAHGAPVVAFRRGGVVETIVEGVTGVFFERQAESDVAAAIVTCLGRRWDETVLRDNADRFSPEKFRQGMAAELTAALDRPRGRVRTA